MKTRKTLLIILGIAVILSVLVYKFAPLDFKKKSDKKYTIGVNIPQTGNLATIGEQIKSGMDLALIEINDTTFKVVYQDSKGNAKDGLSATNFLLDNTRTDFMIVNLTSVAMASKHVLSSMDVQAIYLSTHPEMTTSCTNCFRLFTSGKQEGDLLVNEITKAEPEKIGLLYVKDAYGEGTVSYIKNNLEKIDPNITFSDLSYPISGFDFGALLTRAKNTKINDLIVIGYGFEYKTLFQKLLELNYSPNIYSNFSFSNKKGKEISDYKGKIIFTAPTYDITEKRTDAMKIFAESYKNKYNIDPDFNAAYGYDNIKILYKFYKSGQSEFHPFLDTLEYTGAMGKYRFLPDGDINTQLEIVIK